MRNQLVLQLVIEVLTRSSTHASVLYVLIGHEPALPRYPYDILFVSILVTGSASLFHRCSHVALSIALRHPHVYCFPPCGLRHYYPIVLFRDALVLYCLPLYYKRVCYYCLGSVVKSPVLYFPFFLSIESALLSYSCGGQPGRD
jgi:hypothetical protein